MQQWHLKSTESRKLNMACFCRRNVTDGKTFNGIFILFNSTSSLYFRLLFNLASTLYLEFFWSVFSRIRTEYGEIHPYSAQMRKNTDQKNSEYGYFLRSECCVSSRSFNKFCIYTSSLLEVFHKIGVDRNFAQKHLCRGLKACNFI